MANIINQVDYSIGSGIKQSYVVAIPTYNRVDEVVKKTLNTLKTGGVSANQIYLFVANKQQYTLYEQNVPKELYYKIVIGKKGITNQRIFISNYFIYLEKSSICHFSALMSNQLYFFLSFRYCPVNLVLF